MSRSKRDIRQMTREELISLAEELDSKYKTITSTTMDGFWIVDRQGRIVDANETCSKMYGYSREDLAGMSLRDFEALETDDELKEHIEVNIATGYDRFETQHCTRDGHKIHVEVSSSYLPEAKLFMAFVRDITDQKRLVNHLKRSEWLLGKLQRIGNIGIYDYDITNDCWTSSAELDMIFGINSDYPKNLASWSQLIHPDTREKMVSYFVEKMTAKSLFSIEYRIIRPSDGAERWLYGNGEFILDDGGNPVNMIGSIQDITERKNTENELRKIEAIFNLFMEHSPVYVFFKDENIRPVKLSRNFEKMIGMPIDQILGKNMYELFHSEFAKKIVEDDRRVIDKGVPLELEEELNGRWYKTMKFPIFQEGLAPMLAGFTIDITEQITVEKQLRESEERYRNFSSLTSDYTYSCSRRGDEPYRVKWMAGAVDRITGYTQDEIFERGCWLTIVHPDDVRFISEGLARLTPGETHCADFRIIRKDGNVRWIHEVCRCVNGNEPDELLLHGTSQDITDRKQQEHDIKVLNENLEYLVATRTAELEITNTELSNFCYAVSHELRAPIARLQGFTKVLQEDFPHDDDLFFLAKRIDSASQQLQKVVDAILMLSRLSRVEIKLEQVNLSQLAESSVSRLRADNPGSRFDSIIQPGLFAKADRNLLSVCLDNLIGNAVKYSSQTPLARIEFGCEHHQGTTVYYVRDNGVGFDMSFSDKLFTPFERLHQQDEFPGMGIGLATVQRIIDRHGGRLWAEGSIGRGATFYFTL